MLPSITTTTFKAKLISNDKEIEIRPFLAKEQKILLMALEDGSPKEVSDAVMRILRSCIISDIDINKLPAFDIQKLFLELRKRSVGEVIELNLRHPDGSACTHRQPYNVNIDDIKVSIDPDHKKKFMLDDKIGVIMKYPTTEMVNKFGEQSVKNTFTLIANCIEAVYDQEKLYTDFSLDEMMAWIDNLNDKQLKLITHFFQTMPTITHNIDYICSECGEAVHIKLEGLNDFFS